MATSTDHDITILNGLIETTLDSAHGYDEAAKDARNPQFKTLFGKRAIERKQVTAELQGEVRRLGVTPEQDGTILGKAHRVFLNLKTAVGGSDQGVVNEVEAGEDHIKAKYEKALADTDLSAPVRDLILRAYRSVKSGHDEMRALKHALERAS
ncbi:MAG TPA: PA2169 family four-helix-bundle protein [Aliidongia sp.]|uniref:PA2169 family four-helix-bundle protein n=1 Tax=Aliidongia sp. TaxID=1914230 RepID=UPI002DDDB57E|nr:PA2169 family four-helix-bundle protein [Aliidongia sp.]HEV2675012.1 PA2169 family four-helix-bundle protein [Aliidongia sp.]